MPAITARVAIAVNVSDHKEYGCPVCGGKNGRILIASNAGAVVWECGGCRNPYIILEKGKTKSPLFVMVDGRKAYPELREHPRAIARSKADLANLTETVSPDQSDR